jgi:hypothetical protein
MKTAISFGIVLMIIISLYMIASGGVSSSPKIIVADGQTYFACKDLVWVAGDGGILAGGNTFKISFSDAAGVGHMFRGIKTVELSDMPKLVEAPMPINPPTYTSDGMPVVEGLIYTWDDGRKARFRNGTWEAVQIPNNACQSK